MNSYIKADRLSGDNKYSCDSCNKKVNALKSTSIEASPRILSIDFVRYNLGRKNSEIITYPKSFSLKNYMSSAIDYKNAQKLNIKSKIEVEQPNEQIYDLYGVIVHQGSSRYFGHYYSYCRGFESDNTWYKCNDESVSKIGGVESALNK